MRIKRFIAPDMRAALKMVRDEQGPDAVILSNRPTEGGIEVVAATDYDEALVQQALRTAAPTLKPLQAKVIEPAEVPAPARPAAPATPSFAQAALAAATDAPAPAAAAATASRNSLASRARAVFRLGGETVREPAGEPTLAELVGDATTMPAAPEAAPAPTRTQRFDDMMAALAPMADEAPTRRHSTLATPVAEAAAPAAADPMGASDAFDSDDVTVSLSTQPAAVSGSDNQPSPALACEQGREQSVAATATLKEAAPAPVLSQPVPARNVDEDRTLEKHLSPTLPCTQGREQTFPTRLELEPAPRRARFDAMELSLAPMEATCDVPASARTDETPSLQVVAGRDLDPTVTAMRDELSAMRQLIEREMGQFAVERMRGSPARAAAYDALVGYGCEDHLAQAVAAKLDPQLDPAKVHAPMLAHLAQMLTVARAEPIDDGGVIALIGPTGAGKTTTLAKMAARFAQRHRARDVALVTTDNERAGAREQLQAHGRRLGITVCEADGPEGLAETLDQLADYPLVLVDTAGYAARDRALLGQITWLRATRNVRCLLALPATAHPADLNEVVRRYRMAAPEGVVLTKLDETGRLGGVLSVAVRNGLNIAYTTDGQHVPSALDAADASRLVLQLEKLRRAADNPLITEDRHAHA
ncbi:flagellar biosynthesis protein FlhF [Novilysobacter selenitireducens]|uniref:Flagellar biosynthesis protein FlhF n=1 Tax=Novilysobacter selenitireducens TaxID=2872639 RepID=A0ABS7T988_9GAMM|nr:flagellar biosynthesis protein FlhF [Lysobacter selenitireducens]MBZ4040459.1 flagellar biosynthesis protein FlhF [Lysobacter selenitireducens]